jgi:hypothetical protein
VTKKYESRYKLTKHHRLPKAHGGSNSERNISVVPMIKHRAYHTLFGSMPPDLIAAYLTAVWIDPDYEMIIRRKI